MDILDKIIADKRIELMAQKSVLPASHLYDLVESIMNKTEKPESMSEALRSSELGVIAEFKRRSPSKGWIKETGGAGVIPLSYQKNGATAVSILADNKYFGGQPDYIGLARYSGVTIPILYKEFILDEYQLFMARYQGASAVLLIAACLTENMCRSLISTAHSLGLEVLLEMHSEKELEYVTLKPDMCGINNRNLGTFTTDMENSFRLAEKLPDDAIKVSESGISKASAIISLRKVGFRGFLVGECFMKEEDPGLALNNFIKTINEYE